MTSEIEVRELVFEALLLRKHEYSTECYAGAKRFLPSVPVAAQVNSISNLPTGESRVKLPKKS